MEKFSDTGASANTPRRICGWCEWASLPALGIVSIKAKLDTGARTSVLHAWDVESYEEEGQPWVRFRVYPLQRSNKKVVRCAARIEDRRWVTNSGGSREWRIVISTDLTVGGESWPIELTLANRDEMGYRVLIGREAMRGRLIIDPDAAYTTGRPGSGRHRTAKKRKRKTT